MNKQQKYEVIGQNQAPYTSSKGVMGVENAFREEQLSQFKKIIKIGVYKQLHQKKMLTDAQLNELIKINRVKDYCTS